MKATGTHFSHSSPQKTRKWKKTGIRNSHINTWDTHLKFLTTPPVFLAISPLFLATSPVRNFSGTFLNFSGAILATFCGIHALFDFLRFCPFPFGPWRCLIYFCWTLTLSSPTLASIPWLASLASICLGGKVSGSPHIPHHLLDTCLQPIVFALQAAILQRCITSSARPPWHNFWNSRWASIALLQLQQDALDLQPKAHRVRPEHTWRCQLLLIKTIYATIEAQTVFVSTVWCRSNCGFHPSWVSFQLPSRCTVCVQPLWVFHGLKDRWHGCCSKPCAFSLEDDNCTLVRFL